jgi:flagellar basal-body rod protein FlgG
LPRRSGVGAFLFGFWCWHFYCIFLGSDGERGLKMIPVIYNVIDGFLVQKLRFDSIANNMANISTPGFKKDFISFDQTLSRHYESLVDHDQGPILATGNQLDLAIERRGFFKIITPEGPQYTRSGSFSQDADGVLMTHSGNPVMGENGPVQIAGGTISVDSRGAVLVDGQPVDRLSIVDFEDLSLLEKGGGGLFSHPDGENAEQPAENAVIHQGCIEQSNVNPTEEMIKMVETFRAYEANHKAIQALDEMTRKLVNNYAMQG